MRTSTESDSDYDGMMTDDEKPPILAHSHKDEGGDESHGRQYDYYERNTTFS